MSTRENAFKAGRPSARSANTKTLASLSDGTTMARVNFQLSADLHKKLKMHAARNDTTIKELLTDYIRGLPNG